MGAELGCVFYGLWALIEINIEHWDADMLRWSASVQCFCRGGLWGHSPSRLDACLHLLALNEGVGETENSLEQSYSSTPLAFTATR